MIAKQIRLFGRVQGVGFRYYILQKAHKLHIKGFVRNEPDGTVYIEAEAPDEKTMNIFIEYLKQGPALARVDKYQVNDLPVQHFTDFVIK